MESPASLEQCPWYELRAWSGPPNVDWCEEALCQWAAEPANTWSNLAFLFVSAGLFVTTRDTPERTLRFFAPAAFWVGITSLVYHASISFGTQVLDFFGMYFFFLLILVLNLVRLKKVPREKLFVVLWPSILAFTVLTVVVAKLELPIQGIIGVLLVGTIATEVWASRVSTTPVQHRYFVLAIITIAAAGTFSALDVSRTWCDPKDHIFQGHAIWHVLSSVALVWSYLHYRQFRSQFI